MQFRYLLIGGFIGVVTLANVLGDINNNNTDQNQAQSDNTPAPPETQGLNSRLIDVSGRAQGAFDDTSFYPITTVATNDILYVYGEGERIDTRAGSFKLNHQEGGTFYFDVDKSSRDFLNGKAKHITITFVPGGATVEYYTAKNSKIGFMNVAKQSDRDSLNNALSAQDATITSVNPSLCEIDFKLNGDNKSLPAYIGEDDCGKVKGFRKGDNVHFFQDEAGGFNMANARNGKTIFVI